jgi:beta-glucanase (GH16 family)
MPGISQRVMSGRERAPRWRLRGGLALAIIAPVIAVAAAMVPAASAAVAAPAVVAAPAAVPGAPSGWSTVFSDDFAGASGSGVDGQWMYDTGPGSNFGTGEIETMTNSTANVHEDGNGNLDLTALGSGSSWTSGRVQTTSANVGAPAGGELEVTASIQQPTGGLGYWPAFWMLGPGQWPENGEIDIMEDVNALSEVAGTVHCGVDPGGPCNETSGIGSGLRACSGCQSGFHTYTMILNRTNTAAESITFYLDGTSYFTATEAQIGTSTWQAAFDHNLSILLDLAMGGGFPNGVCGCTTPTSATTSGGTMSVAYVAAYTTGGGGTTPPPPPPGSGPITGINGLCVDVRGASSADSTPVQVYTCNGTNAQQWTVVQAGSTLHALGKCLDIAAGGTANGTKVQLYTCNGTGAQVFIPQSNGELMNPQSNRCLDDTGFGGSGTQLQIWDCADSSNQIWHLP